MYLIVSLVPLPLLLLLFYCSTTSTTTTPPLTNILSTAVPFAIRTTNYSFYYYSISTTVTLGLLTTTPLAINLLH